MGKFVFIQGTDFYLEKRRRELSCAVSLSLQSVLAQLPMLYEGVQPSSSTAFRENLNLMKTKDLKPLLQEEVKILTCF